MKQKCSQTNGVLVPREESTKDKWQRLAGNGGGHFRSTEQLQTISVKTEGEEEVDIDFSVLGSWEEVAADNLEAGSNSTLCNKLVMQHSDKKDLGCKRDREYNNALQRPRLYDKERQPGIRVQQKLIDKDTDHCQSKPEVTRQGLPCEKSRDRKSAAEVKLPAARERA